VFGIAIDAASTPAALGAATCARTRPARAFRDNLRNLREELETVVLGSPGLNEGQRRG
jgi:hypothetical protein